MKLLLQDVYVWIKDVFEGSGLKVNKNSRKDVLMLTSRKNEVFVVMSGSLAADLCISERTYSSGMDSNVVYSTIL